MNHSFELIKQPSCNHLAITHTRFLRTCSNVLY